MGDGCNAAIDRSSPPVRVIGFGAAQHNGRGCGGGGRAGLPRGDDREQQDALTVVQNNGLLPL